MILPAKEPPKPLEHEDAVPFQLANWTNMACKSSPRLQHQLYKQQGNETPMSSKESPSSVP